MRLGIAAVWVVGSVAVVSTASADTLQVGPGKTFPTPCAAIAAASDDDIIEVDASGNYDGDVCGWTRNGLTIRGVNGRAHIDAAGHNAQGKAIWVIAGNDTTIENIELSGATVPDQNGAGIRQEGVNLTVRGCYFHDNEDGILAGDKAGSEIVIEYTEFANNGYGDGYTHNLYVNHVARLIFRHNYSHHAKIGHLLKSRAAENYVLYNRLTGENGTDSYEIDLPNGGLSYLLGNLVQQGPNTDNSSIVSYQREGAHAANPSHQLVAVNNTFVNDRPSGGTFFNIDGSVADPVVLRNNIFVGPGTIISQGNAIQDSNFQGDPGFVNAATYDYHLQAASPCIDQGSAPGTLGGYDLTPLFQYVHPASAEGRSTVGTIDIGAYEYGGGVGGTGGSGGAGTGGAGGAGGGSTGGAGGSGGTDAGAGGGATGGDGGAAGGAGGTSGGAGGAGGGAGASTGGEGGSSAGSAGAAGTSGATPANDEPSGCACRTSMTSGSSQDRLAVALAVLSLMLVRRRRAACM
jgi:MYXO-CTERM domain-containing protein